MIKAIETEYAGYRFRSRLEARWAVFFETGHIKYEYEPQGFVLKNGSRYLPDFYLPELDTFVEVKPDTEKGRKEYQEDINSLTFKALKAARQARFEHGEMPAVGG